MVEIHTYCFFDDLSPLLLFLARFLVSMAVCHISDRLSSAWAVSYFSLVVVSKVVFCFDEKVLFFQLNFLHEYGSQGSVAPGFQLSMIVLKSFVWFLHALLSALLAALAVLDTSW